MNSAFKNVTNFDLKDKKYHSKHVEVGCAAAQIILKLIINVMEFEGECREYAIGVIKKLRKRILSLRATEFIKKASCLDQKIKNVKTFSLVIEKI